MEEKMLEESRYTWKMSYHINGMIHKKLILPYIADKVCSEEVRGE